MFYYIILILHFCFVVFIIVQRKAIVGYQTRLAENDQSLKIAIQDPCWFLNSSAMKQIYASSTGQRQPGIHS
jgi:hypothetical protein